MEEDLYCKVYVDGNYECSDLMTLIAEAINGNILLRVVENKLFNVTVFKNEDYDKDRIAEVGGFVFFPYYLEIEPNDETSVISAEYKSLVGDLLETLWKAGADAVVACDFEDELPKKVA